MRTFSLLCLLSLLLYPSLTTSDDYTTFVYAGCSQPRYIPGSTYELSVDSVLTSIANSAPFSSYNNFTSPTSSLSALYQCRSDLPLSTCSSCVRSALSQLSTLCPSTAGAAVQLRGCFIRYGNDSFLGQPDTTLIFKKCGSPAEAYGGSGGGDVLGMREAALGTVQAAAGEYRVDRAGYVQAEAQCVGDIGVADCSGCVAAAAAEVKSVCTYAGAGEVYLGKCYARYWADKGYSPSSSYSHQDNEDETGKTLAIIIGLVAGVALIIVFVSFLRRAAGNGK